MDVMHIKLDVALAQVLGRILDRELDFSNSQLH